jgi:hypothetical protein
VNGTNFEHACFISYKHPPKTAPPDHFYREFAVHFQRVLERHLSTTIRTYLDEDADIGSAYPQELSRRLCRSVCMIAILVPEYPDSSWCAAEWAAMEMLEMKRLGGKRGLILPIALKRSADEWNRIYKRKPADFSKVAVPANQLETVKQVQKIQEIAAKIEELVKQVHETCEDCTKFMLTIGEEKLNLTPTFKDPALFD